MASTNKTTNLELSQFLGTDKPAWLTDYNSDMQKIDDGFKKQANDIDVLDGRTTNLEAGLGDSNTEIETVKNDVQSLKDEDVIIKRDINTLATNYDTIHHETAINTQNIEDIKNEYLPLTGGKLTGNLDIEGSSIKVLTESNGRIALIMKQITKGNAPAVNSESDLVISDSNGSKIGAFITSALTDKTKLTLEIVNVLNPSESNTLTLGFDTAGKKYCKVVTPDSNSNSTDVATTAWVRNLLVSLGMTSATLSNVEGGE